MALKNEFECFFCEKNKCESELIDMNVNSLLLDTQDVLEFNELLREIFDQAELKLNVKIIKYLIILTNFNFSFVLEKRTK